MGILTEWITEWLKGLLIEGIMGNLEGLFDTVNTSTPTHAPTIMTNTILTSTPLNTIPMC